MIQRLSDMVAGPGIQAGLPDGRWVRAVPSPFQGGLVDRCRDAWAVLSGRAYAIQWPKAGELEAALNPRERPTKGQHA